MSNMLVTGGAGFIGSNFVKYYTEHHHVDQLIVLDALTYAGRKENLHNIKHPGFKFIEGNILSSELVYDILRSNNITTIVHFAAESHVDRSIDSAGAFIETNVVGTFQLLEAARRAWIDNQVDDHRFHHISTDEVFGSLSPTAAAFTETSIYAPNSPYSASKAASDHLVRSYQQTYGLQTTMSHCSNNYGPYHFPEKLIPLCILNILHNRALPIYGSGTQIRDWLHVQDHCRAVAMILDGGKTGVTYNIGGCNEQQNITVVKKLCEIVDDVFLEYPELCQQYPHAPPSQRRKSECLIEFVSDRLGHDERYAIDCEKLTSELGYQPCISWEVGLKDTVKWYLNNRAWWLPIYNTGNS